jgi:spore coat protein U-like protein
MEPDVKNAAFGIFAILLLAASPVLAGEATAILGVSATIANVCRVSTSAISFGGYDPIGANASAPLNASGAVSIACTKGAATTVGLGSGANADGSARRMKDGGSNLLTYELYKPPSAEPRAPCLYDSPAVWTNISGGLLAPGAAPDKNVRSYSICGQVFAGQSLPAGGYADTILVTVNF